MLDGVMGVCCRKVYRFIIRVMLTLIAGRRTAMTTRALSAAALGPSCVVASVTHKHTPLMRLT
jgi:hypothetical protein